jgi:hypothetical protein
VPVGRVESIDLRRERVREFLELRATTPDNVLSRFALVEHATRRGLPGLARLAALELILATPVGGGVARTDLELERLERAHELLGHRRAGGSGAWLWFEHGRWLPLREWIEDSSKWGREAEFWSEHFRMRTSGGPDRAVAALFDAERLLIWLHDRFGEALRLQEILEPIELRVWGDAADFPRWSAGVRNEAIESRPYFLPTPFGNAVCTYYPPSAWRPERWFSLLTQAVLYNALVTDASVTTIHERFATWAELGLGSWVESCVVDAAPAPFASGSRSGPRTRSNSRSATANASGSRTC